MAEPIRIGGTLASDILNCGFGTPLSAWSILTGRVEKPDLSGEEHIQAGIHMELAARNWYEARTGLKVLPGGLVMDKEIPWAGGTLDGLVHDDVTAAPIAVWEGKNTSLEWKDEDGGIPLRYQVQGQFYLRVTGLMRVNFAAIIHGRKLVTPTMDRNDDFIAAMMAEIQRFIDECVIRDVPPPVVARDLGILSKLYPRDSGETVTFAAGSVEDAALLQLFASSAVRKIAEKEEDEAKAVLQASMKDATEIVTPSGVATWKYERAEYKPQPARTVEKRVFRSKKP